MALKDIAQVQASNNLYWVPFGTSPTPTSPPPTSSTGTVNPSLLQDLRNTENAVLKWLAKEAKDVLNVAVATAALDCLRKYGPQAVNNAIQTLKGANTPAEEQAAFSQINSATPGLGDALQSISTDSGGLTGTQLDNLVSTIMNTPGSIIDEGGGDPPIVP